MAVQVQDDAAFARQLQMQEQQMAQGQMQPPLQMQQMGGVPQMQMQQGIVVQGRPVGSGPPGGNPEPVAYGADWGQQQQMYPGMQQQMHPGMQQGVIIQPGMQPGMMQPGMQPYAVAVVGPELPPEEMLVLRHKYSMTCFASIDVVSTALNALSAVMPRDEEDAEEEGRERTLFGFQGLDAQYIGLIGLAFLIGPICGLVGARTLKRNMVAVYLVFCVLKLGFEIAAAIITPHLWLILIALIQIWITKIIFTFWQSLGLIAPERLKELADPSSAAQRGPVRMVFF